MKRRKNDKVFEIKSFFFILKNNFCKKNGNEQWKKCVRFCHTLLFSLYIDWQMHVINMYIIHASLYMDCIYD
jgi:hypothetical protein